MKTALKCLSLPLLLATVSSASAQSLGEVLLIGEATKVEIRTETIINVDGDQVPFDTVWYTFADGFSWSYWPDGDIDSGTMLCYDAQGHVTSAHALNAQNGAFFCEGTLPQKPFYVTIETKYNERNAPLGYAIGGLESNGPGQWWFEAWW